MARKRNNLAKTFISSAVRQFGRDAGKVMSNQVYGDAHSTPIRIVGQLGSKKSTNIPFVSNDEFEISNQPLWQPEFKSWGRYILLWIVCTITLFPLIILVPYSFFNSLGLLLRKKTTVLAIVPNRVSDRRCKEGYRDEGYIRIETNQKREFTDLELDVRRKIAKVDLLNCLTLVGGTILAIYYAFTDESYNNLVIIPEV